MNVSREDITSKRRIREIIIARQTATYLISKKFRKSLVEVGRYFNCDHSTVIHSKRAVENCIETELEYREKIKEMKIILRIP
jgi:chromosomal replication initiation ATPase DnaA